MPSLADVHGGSRSVGASSDGPWGGERPASAGDAAQVSLQLSAVGLVLFLLGIGFAFFFDSILGTVGYLAALGLATYGLVRWVVATVPTRDLPDVLARGAGATGRPRRTTVPDRIRARLSVVGRTRRRGTGWSRSRGRLGSRGRTRRGGASRVRARAAAPLVRLRGAVSSLRSTRGGERL